MVKLGRGLYPKNFSWQYDEFTKLRKKQERKKWIAGLWIKHDLGKYMYYIDEMHKAGRQLRELHS